MDQINPPFVERFFMLPIASGILLVLALPWIGFSWCAWFGLVPLFLFIGGRNTTYRRAFQGGLVTGVVYFSAVAYPLLSLNAWWWLQADGVVRENKIIMLFWILYLAVLIGSALFGIFAVIFKKLHREGLFSVIVLSGAWVLLEYIRARLLFGFTWGHLGYDLYDTAPLVQFGYYGGVYSLDFLIILLNILLYYAVHRAVETARTIEGSSKVVLFFRFVFKQWHLYVSMLIFIAAFFGGALLDIPTSSKHQIPVAVIQPGLHQSSKEDETATLTLLEDALRASPMLAVIPESAFPLTVFDEDTKGEVITPFAFSSPRKGESSYQKLVALSKEYPASSIAIGLDSKKGAALYNSLVVFENGNPVSVYHKRLLFPFSERSVGWFPWGTIEPLGQGAERQTVTIQGEPVDTLICSEVLFPTLLKGSTSKYVIAVGNDGVFDSPAVAIYNDAIARFDAVETRKYVIRAMKTGVSSIIDPYGRVVVRSDGIGEDLLTANIVY